MTNLGSLALVMATLGQIAFCVTLLLMQSDKTQTRVPLCLFFLTCAVVVADPVLVNFLPSMRIQAIALTLPAYLLMAPVLWLYVEGLTSETPWKLESKHRWHFVPSVLGLVVAGLVIALPQRTLEKIFFEEDLGDSEYLGVLFTVAFVLIIGLIAQSGIYIVKIFRRLASYRRRLKSLFANIEHRELLWINVVLIVFVITWGIVAAGLISENFFANSLISRRLGEVVVLTLVWITGLWGLRQKPGFEGRYPGSEFADKPETSKVKYSRSALSEEHAQRIANKIDTSMREDLLYLQSDLSLSKLADHTGASTNHISQTLNETLGMSFFDYVNRWRIEASKPKIMLGEETVLAVALGVGFNTSSSFYKAFKKETGKTPRAFRAAVE